MKIQELFNSVDKVLKGRSVFQHAVDEKGCGIFYDSFTAVKWSLYGAFRKAYTCDTEEKDIKEYRRIIAAMKPHYRINTTTPVTDYTMRQDVNPEDVIQLVKDADV